MNEEIKERRCKSCGKKLIDEKIPFCLRCTLNGRDKTKKILGITGTVTFLGRAGMSKMGISFRRIK